MCDLFTYIEVLGRMVLNKDWDSESRTVLTLTSITIEDKLVSSLVIFTAIHNETKVVKFALYSVLLVTILSHQNSTWHSQPYPRICDHGGHGYESRSRL